MHNDFIKTAIFDHVGVENTLESIQHIYLWSQLWNDVVSYLQNWVFYQ